MSQLILSVLLAFQGGPAHAELHPAQADLYLAVPDVQRIVDAYGNAPVLQTVNEEAMRSFLGDMASELESDPRAMLAGLIDRVVPGASAMVAGMKSVSFSFALDPSVEKPFGIQLVATFDSAESAQAAQKFALESGEPVGAIDVAGLTGTQRFTSAALEGMELWCTTLGENFVLGGGSTSAPQLGARLAGAEPGLQQSELLAGARKVFGEGSGATVFWLAQRRSPVEVLGEADQAGAIMSGGLMAPYESIPSFLDPLAGKRVMRMQLRGNQFVTEMFSPTGMEAGALGGVPLERQWLARVPADAMFVYSSSVNGQALGPKLAELLTFLGEGEDLELGQVFGDVGPGMAVYLFPVNGIGAPQTHAWVEVGDSAAFTAKITALCEKLAEEQPGITVRTREYKVKNKVSGERVPFPVTTITLPPEVLDLGPMFPTSPAFAALDGEVLFGLSSMHVKRELKRLYGGAEDEASGDPFSTNALELPEDARSVFFMDWGMQIEAALSLVRALGGMAGDQIPFDLNAMPDGKAFTRYLRPTFHVSRGVEGGTYRYHEASFGPETWIGISGLLFGLTGMAPAQEIPLEPVGTPPADEAGD